jgi:hypothetical protein
LFNHELRRNKQEAKNINYSIYLSVYNGNLPKKSLTEPKLIPVGVTLIPVEK